MTHILCYITLNHTSLFLTLHTTFYWLTLIFFFDSLAVSKDELFAVHDAVQLFASQLVAPIHNRKVRTEFDHLEWPSGEFGVGQRWKCAIRALRGWDGSRQFPHTNPTECAGEHFTRANVHSADHDAGRKAGRCTANSSNSGAEPEPNPNSAEISKYSDVVAASRVSTANGAHRIDATRQRNASKSRFARRCHSISSHSTARSTTVCTNAIANATNQHRRIEHSNDHGRQHEQFIER